MKVLRNPGKVDIIVNLFDEVGASYTVDQVCDMSGVANYNSLKATFSYIRHAKHIPDENRVDIRIKGERCVRVN